jgi:Spy/CpxP family protein refolding chaperone
MSALPPPARSRWNVTLIVSLCVNLLLAGVIAMAVVRFGWHQSLFPMGGPMGGGPMQGMVERQQVHQIMSPRVLMHVVPGKQDALRAVTKAHRDRLNTLKADALNARREVVRLYTAPSYDKPALKQAFARVQAADAAFEIEMLKIAAETGALLTPEERQKVIVPQPHDRGGPGWRRHGDDQPNRGDR